ncbi:PyrR bifunctional protein [gamma proteobacterium HTCC5015]|nr:PyrR bifunctional protein [gamma proteobacterium HTCC5015]
MNCSPLISKLADQLADHVDDNTVIVGIHTGGAWVAQALQQRLPHTPPIGALNITFYRDDFTQKGLHPNVLPSDINFEIEGKTVILVDDVLYTGRTIRAALNELFDFGRPSRVLLAVLLERNGRELPISADALGESITLKAGQYIRMHGPEPLEYEIVE